MKLHHSLFVVCLSILLSGCCSFVPCHMGTRVAGLVVDTNGEALVNARVALYGTKTTTRSGGCFNMNLPDALPFELSVEANGYKTAKTKALPGFYRIHAVLAPVHSTIPSRIEWIRIGESEYNGVQPCK